MISWALFLLAGTLAAICGVSVGRYFEPETKNAWIDICATAVPAALMVLLVDGPVPVSKLIWSMILISGLTALFSIDAKTRLVPDLLTIPMIVLGLCHAALQTQLFQVFAVTSIGVILVAYLVSLVMRNKTSWIGAGDVLLFSGAMAWFGPGLAPDLLVLTGAFILLWFLAAKLLPTTEPASGDRFLPLAPALGAAQVAIWMGGPLL
ncbi:MAG: prepilin peptidase [Marinosulfonomonas sp.]